MPRQSGVSIETTIYSTFKGADFSTDPSLVHKTRSPLCTNMISDGGGVPEKRCGWRTLHTLEGAGINGLWSAKIGAETVFLAHAGNCLYSWDETDTEPVLLLSGLNNGKSQGVSLSGKLWIVTGGEYICYDGEAKRVSQSEAYIPTTVITREPTGGGTTYESINLLSPYRKNGFQTDGTAKTFTLDSDNIDTALTASAAIAADTAVYFADGTKYWCFACPAMGEGDTVSLDFEAATATVGETEAEMTEAASATGTDLATLAALTDRSLVTAEVWGEAVTAFTVCRAAGTVTFTTAPAAPSAGSADGLTVTFPKTVDGYADMANKCRIITTYGMGTSDRVILSGNPDYPNRDWTSGLNDPTYISDLSYATVGIEGVPIMGYCRIGSNLGIVKEDNGQDSTVFLRSASLNDSGEAIFTLSQAIAGVGAVSRGSFATLLDEPLFLSGTGIYAMTTSYLTSEKISQNRSYYLNARLTKESLENAQAVTWNGLYLISTGRGHVYVLDGRQEKTYRSESLGDFCYEGYYWENVPADCWLCYKDGAEETLYFGTSDGRICRFNTDIHTMARFADDDGAIDAVWATKMDDDGCATVLKTMIKRGAAVTLKPYTRSSARVCFRTDQNPVDYQASEGTVDIFDWGDIDFSRFTFDSNDGPREIFFAAKVKKYKRLQIVIRNSAINEGFGVYAITKHYVEGNFAKR